MDRWVDRWTETLYILLCTYGNLHCRYYLAKALTYTFYTNIYLCEDVQCLIYYDLKRLNTFEIYGIN